VGAHAAAAPVFFLFKRSRIGALLILAGVLAVVAGCLLPLNGFPGGGADQNALLPRLPGTGAVGLPLGPGSALALPTAGNATLLDMVRHTFDHPLLTSGIGSIIIDLGVRIGAGLIVLAVVTAFFFNLIPMARGMVGLLAGLGLMGTAMVGGVIIGEHMRSLGICSGSLCAIDLQTAVWVIAAGFAVVLIGSAVGSMRFSGLLGGIALATTGFGMGAGLAYLVANQHVLDVVTQSTLGLPHVISP
jgi:hypothetical protein